MVFRNRECFSESGRWYSETRSGIRKLGSDIPKLGMVFGKELVGNWSVVFGN